MKKALIIIGAVFAGLALLAIVGSMLPSDEPQKVVIVKETMEATPIPAVETPATLSGEEEKVYEFIASSYPKVDALFAETCEMVDGEGEALDDIQTLIDNATAFATVAEKWADMDYAMGEVGSLESAFEEYMVASRKFYKNWLNGINGGNVTQCAKNAVVARNKAEKWAPRVEERLAEIEDTIY